MKNQSNKYHIQTILIEHLALVCGHGFSYGILFCYFFQLISRLSTIKSFYLWLFLLDGIISPGHLTFNTVVMCHPLSLSLQSVCFGCVRYSVFDLMPLSGFHSAFQYTKKQLHWNRYKREPWRLVWLQRIERKRQEKRERVRFQHKSNCCAYLFSFGKEKIVTGSNHQNTFQLNTAKEKIVRSNKY